MKKVSKTLLLSFGISVPVIASPMLLLTSCSQVWGYNTPIQFGSAIRANKSNPFYNFVNAGSTMLDGNGNNMVSYLQSNYSIDSRTGGLYAYSNPVTKWTYTNQEAESKQSQLMPISEWETKNPGWYSSSSSEFTKNYSFKGTKDADKHITYINNKNVVQAANVSFTSSIASTVSNYLAGALKYQASQINSNDTNLNIAWGSAAGFMSEHYTLNHGTKDAQNPESTENKLNNDFYEYLFAEANTHVTSKNNHGTFLRTSSVNFNYDSNYFPIPSYSFSSGAKEDISLATKKLLMGPNATATSKWCEAGTTEAPTIPVYYSSKTDGTLSHEYEKDVAGKTVILKIPYTDYVFNNVPVLISVNDLTQRWVNPTMTSSIHVKDYYVEDKSTIQNTVGKFEKIGNYTACHAGLPTIKEYKLDVAQEDGSGKIQINVKPSTIGEKTDCFDTRIVNSTSTTLNGNKFIALITYTIREYDNNKHIYKNGKSGGSERADYTDTFTKIMDDTGMTIDQVKAYLRASNVAELSTTGNIFPAYFLNIYDDLFVKAYTAKDESVQDACRGYILNSNKISSHCNALTGLLNRTTTEGYKASASELSEDSKNLLAFLTYMFKTVDGTNTINVKDFMSFTPLA